MELNKITKGMSNAAEAIDNNFISIEQNIELVDIASMYTLSEGVTDFRAFRFGKLIWIAFAYQPTKTGFTLDILSSELKPVGGRHVAMNVGTSANTPDSAKGVSAYMRGDGKVNVVAPELPTGAMIFSCVFIHT